MKIIKIILCIITVLFSVLGFTEFLSFDVANRIAFISLATLLLLRGIEFKKNRDNGGFILMILIAIFLYCVVLYKIFIDL